MRAQVGLLTVLSVVGGRGGEICYGGRTTLPRILHSNRNNGGTTPPLKKPLVSSARWHHFPNLGVDPRHIVTCDFDEELFMQL